jgi:hypothetical protein
MTFTQSTQDYDRESATVLLKTVQTSRVDSLPTARAKELRLDALTELRSAGDEGQDAASLVTRVIPNADNTVPVYVERARFDGTDAILVIEAYGRPSAALDAARLWVMSLDGRILFSAMR